MRGIRGMHTLTSARLHLFESCRRGQWALQIFISLIILLGLLDGEGRAWAMEFKVACPASSPTLLNLKSRLARADTPRQWAKIYEELTVALQVLDERWLKGLTQSSDKLKQVKSELECAHALALESAIYLSDERLTGRLWAMRAVSHAVSLSSINMTSLSASRAQSWLKLVRQRALRQPGGGRPQLQHLLGEWTLVQAPSQEKPYHLTIYPRGIAQWAAQCGLIKGCQELMPWRIYARRETPLQFLTPSSHYRADWSGPCVNTRSDLNIQASEAHARRFSSQMIQQPSLSCSSQLKLLDVTSREPLEVATLFQEQSLKLTRTDLEPPQPLSSPLLPEGSTVKVSLAGYRSVNVKAPMWGEVVEGELERCTRPIELITTPRDAKVSGPKRATWGRSARLSVSRSGYESIKRSVMITREDSCLKRPHQEQVELSRSIEVIAQDPSGLNIPLDELMIGGLSIGVDQGALSHQRLIRPVGEYRVDARVQGYQALSARLKVPSCLDSSCDAVKLQLSFNPPPPPPPSTSDHLRWLGGGALIAGAGVLGFAYQRQLLYEDQLNYTHNLTRARSRITTTRSWGWGILATGAVTSLIGWMWPALTSKESSAQATSELINHSPSVRLSAQERLR